MVTNINSIENRELGVSVREKLNEVIATLNNLEDLLPSGPPGPQGIPGPPGTGIRVELNVIGTGFSIDEAPLENVENGDAFVVIGTGEPEEEPETGTDGLIETGTDGINDNGGPLPLNKATVFIYVQVTPAIADPPTPAVFQWVEAFTFTVPLEISTENVLYVSKGGNDARNSGQSLNESFKTIKHALEVAIGFSKPVSILVYPGKYIEEGNLVVPENSSVIGVGGQYATEVIAAPGFESTNMFLVNSGSYIQGFTFRNQVIDDFDDPSGGFGVAFAPDATIVRSPYIRDCGQVSNYGVLTVDVASDTVNIDFKNISAPLDPNPAEGPPNPLVGNGGGVLLADRAVLNTNSIFPYMLAFGATPRSPNGIGYCAKNGAGINGISSISVFQQCAFYALDGGQITLNNSGTQFGDISMRAKGSTPIVRPENPSDPSVFRSIPEAADVFDNEFVFESIANQAWQFAITQAQNTYQIGGFNTPENEEFTKRDTRNFLRALAFDLRGGTFQSSQSFVLGFFDFKADYAFDPNLVDLFIDTLDEIAFLVNTLIDQSGLPSGDVTDAADMVTQLKNLVNATLGDPQKVQFGSLIESLGHQFNNAGAGVNKNALPLNFRRPGRNRPVPFSVRQEAGGRVRFSGADEFNNQYFAGGTRINGLTGRFEGRPFDSAVRQIARRLANSRAFV